MYADTCFYDGHCGMCRRTRRVLSALDWLGALRWVDQTRVAPERLPVPLDAALSGMPMVTGGGEVLVGYPAVRRALARTPVGACVAWLLYVPGIALVGKKVYDEVARRRVRTCAVHRV